MNFIKTTLKGALVLAVVIAIVLLITLLTPISIVTTLYLTFVFIGFSYLLGMLMELENSEKESDNMDDNLYDDIYNELNRFPEEPDSDSVEGILLDALDSEFEEIIIIGKSSGEYSLAFNYDDDLTALGMLRQAEHHILKMIDDD